MLPLQELQLAQGQRHGGELLLAPRQHLAHRLATDPDPDIRTAWLEFVTNMPTAVQTVPLTGQVGQFNVNVVVGANPCLSVALSPAGPYAGSAYIDEIELMAAHGFIKGYFGLSGPFAFVGYFTMLLYSVANLLVIDHPKAGRWVTYTTLCFDLIITVVLIAKPQVGGGLQSPLLATQLLFTTLFALLYPKPLAILPPLLALPITARLDQLLDRSPTAIEVLTLLWSPAKEATVPNLVPADRLTSVNSLSMVAAYGTFPVASLLLAVLATISARLADVSALDPLRFDREGGLALAFYVDVCTFLIAAFLVSRLNIPHRTRAERSSHGERTFRRRPISRSAPG